MLNLLPFLMCGGGGRAPAPVQQAYVPPPPPPAPKKQPLREVKLKQGGVRGASEAKTGSVGAGTGGTLLTGLQGVGDASLSTGKTMLGG
jgi:hypothetical protein